MNKLCLWTPDLHQQQQPSHNHGSAIQEEDVWEDEGSTAYIQEDKVCKQTWNLSTSRVSHKTIHSDKWNLPIIYFPNMPPE